MNSVNLLLSATGEPDIMIKGIFKYNLFGQEFWITTTHVNGLIIIGLILAFAIIVRVKLKSADEQPGMLQNIAELGVEMLDNMVNGSMGKQAGRYRNYIGTIFIFILLSNMSGLLGLRSPTADYGTTFALGLFTFVIIQYNNIRFNKTGAFTSLFQPVAFMFPINLIGEISTPLSISLRLFGNVLSGTIMLGLVYGLLPQVAQLIWPAALHAYLDVFAGAIQTYVFCMLTMVYVAEKCPE